MGALITGVLVINESFMREFAECLFRYVNIHTPLLQTLLILYQGEQNG
jgi:hypothetical protein